MALSKSTPNNDILRSFTLAWLCIFFPVLLLLQRSVRVGRRYCTVPALSRCHLYFFRRARESLTMKGTVVPQTDLSDPPKTSTRRRLTGFRRGFAEAPFPVGENHVQ